MEFKDLVQTGFTFIGMIAIGGIAWGKMGSQVGFMREIVSQLKQDSERDRELCEWRCVERVGGVKTTADRAHNRLDEHVQQHPGPTRVGGVVG